MLYPKLMVRPRSTHTVTKFGGLNHNLEAPLGQWYDERNLSADGYPALQAARMPAVAYNVDGNELSGVEIVAAAGGDHIVLLDRLGRLYCNGHSVQTIGTEGVVYSWSITHVDEENPPLRISPESGSTTDSTALGGLVTRTEPLRIYCTGTGDNPENMQWYYNDATFPTGIRSTYRYVPTDHYSYQWDLYDLGITVASIAQVDAGDYIEINCSQHTSYDQDATYMVRMGAYVLILPDGVMVNVAALADGQDVQPESISSVQHLSRGGWLNFKPCTLDGTILQPQAGVDPPSDHTLIWADTSGDRTVMRQWSSALSSWQAMQATYVRIEIQDLEAAQLWCNDVLRQWDAVRFTLDAGNTDYYDEDGETIFNTRLEDELLYILNSSQVIYKIGEDANSHQPYLVIQGILDRGAKIGAVSNEALIVARQMPQMDFVVECGNRLWGCYYGKNEDGEILNEIYASKLGDPRNWSCYMGLSTDSWTASRGVDAPFTGAAVLDGHPLFFREESLEKVYPSSSGAHQIQTFDLEGVEDGSANSLVVIEDKLYYKSRQGICVYTGTLPQRISAAFGELRYRNGSAARHGRRYIISMDPADGSDRLLAEYDIPTGIWHLMDEAFDGRAVTFEDNAYYIREGMLWQHGGHRSLGGAWYAESGVIGYELPEHRYISCVRIRLELGRRATARAAILYEDSGDWLDKGEIGTAALRTTELNIYPRRCDHFRFRISGNGDCTILSISYRMERSEGGH